jgi:putative FmdB family regulatory protein
MATYDYQCPNPECLRVEVVEHSMLKTPVVTCECCGKRMKRLISGSTTFQLRGSGWAKDNYS